MSYLLDFLRSFNQNELTAFKKLDLVGKEELVRDEYIRQLENKKLDEAKLPAKLQLSPSHFDKINSVLLDKIIFQMFGDDYRKILGDILARGLSGLMLHELRIIQRRILKEKNAAKQ